MLGLVVATNIFQMYIFWELVGVSSYLLIGFYYTKPEAVAASKKAFIVTRFADLGFLIEMCIRDRILPVCHLVPDVRRGNRVPLPVGGYRAGRGDQRIAECIVFYTDPHLGIGLRVEERSTGMEVKIKSMKYEEFNDNEYLEQLLSLIHI